MCNAYKNIAAVICAATMASMTISSCKSATDNTNVEARIALERAQNAFNSGNPHSCIEQLDSLDRKFAGERDIITASMKLRPKALMAITEEEIVAADSTISANKILLDSLKPLMIHIEVPGTEGYMLKKTMVDPGFMNKTGLSPRVSENGEFYLVSSVNPAGGLQHWSVSVIAGDMMATTDTVLYDGALNFRTNNSEVITFTPAASKEIGELVAANSDLPIKILYNGQNGRSHSMSPTASQIDGIATAYRYAAAVNDMRNATINLERLNARKAKLEQQIADLDEPERIKIDTEQPSDQ